MGAPQSLTTGLTGGWASLCSAAAKQTVAVRMNVPVYLHVTRAHSTAPEVACRVLVPPPFTVEPSRITFTEADRDKLVTVSLRAGAEQELAGKLAVGFLCVVAEDTVVAKAIPVRAGRVWAHSFVASCTSRLVH